MESETMDNLKDRLVRLLAASGEAAQLSCRFEKLRTNAERVDFALDLLNRYEISALYIPDVKNDATALEMREKGNEMYKNKQLTASWEMYTKSAMLASNPGENLTFAYANRSAVLYELGLHQECIKDINRAVTSPCPENLAVKLRKRLEKCNKQSCQPWHEKIPRIHQKNPQIQCAASCVEIGETSDKGRHIVAAEDIEPGAILCVEPPFATVAVSAILYHCNHCLRLSYNLASCPNCTQALFCNNCLSREHGVECAILKTLRAMRVDKLKYLPLKLALRLDEDGPRDQVYRSDRFYEVARLVTNEEKRSASDLFGRAVCAAILYDLVRKCTTLGDDGRFKEMLMTQLQSAPSNFHEITEWTPREGSVEFGSGVFPFLSLFNHSCDPNVTRFCYGTTVVMRAIKWIKKGEECCDNYGYHFAIHDKNKRQSKLRAQYHFDCQCRACANNWPLYSNLRHVGNDDVDDDVIDKLSNGDVTAAYSVTSQLEETLKKLHDQQPCQDFCKIQEVLKQVYALMGNKRML